jgi:hypothetical protein
MNRRSEMEEIESISRKDFLFSPSYEDEESYVEKSMMILLQRFTTSPFKLRLKAL